uniref:Uncharacterized protein n=1 Tax=Romanomermis culicivorax TaxID=13658 RepID=A0A915KA58_ROMCU
MPGERDVSKKNQDFSDVLFPPAVHLHDGEDRIMEMLRFAKDKQNVNDSNSPQFPFFLSLEYKILDNLEEQDAWSVTEA